MARIIVFAKAPLAGFAKTRLGGVLGEAGAARLALRLLEDRLRDARLAGVGKVELCATPGPAESIWRDFDLPPVDLQSDQGEGDLGQRMARAAERALAQGDAVLLVGSDCPALDAGKLGEAARALEARDAVLVPALDGGYVLLGLRRFDASLFIDLPWGSETVGAMTLQRLAALGWRVQLFAALPDIDRPEDLAFLPESYAEFRMPSRPVRQAKKRHN